jgi:protoporphyrinogen oxidase
MTTAYYDNMYHNVIVGGGISGLYLAYRLNEPNTLIIEKNKRLGGKIYTYRKNKVQYEVGAGRLGKNQPLIMELIKELKLDHLLGPISNTRHYYLQNRYINNQKELLSLYGISNKSFKSFRQIWQFILDKRPTIKNIYNITLQEYLYMVLDKKVADLIIDTFGYISEITQSNAGAALYTIEKDFAILSSSGESDFVYLGGGLDQIIDSLEKILVNIGVRILTEYECIDVIHQKNHNVVTIKSSKGKSNNIFCRNVFFTIPKKELQSICYFSNDNILDSVEPISLVRIYAKYPTSNGNAWFKDIPKLITDNPIQFIIPINVKTGLIMIVYADNYNADNWDKLFNNHATSPNKQSIAVEKIQGYLNDMFPGITIPKPIWVNEHYWSEGAHVWKKGYDPHKVVEKLANKYNKKGIYVIGEAYSIRSGWIEGCLETVEDILPIIE